MFECFYTLEMHFIVLQIWKYIQKLISVSLVLHKLLLLCAHHVHHLKQTVHNPGWNMFSTETIHQKQI